eukprot:325810_1
MYFVVHKCETLAGALWIFSCLLLIIICAMKLCKDKSISRFALSLFIVSGIIQISGSLVQFLLRSCGQVDIPLECPLTETCNHNCVYHLIQSVGLVLVVPSVLVLIPSKENREEETQMTAIEANERLDSSVLVKLL